MAFSLVLEMDPDTVHWENTGSFHLRGQMHLFSSMSWLHVVKKRPVLFKSLGAVIALVGK